MRKRERDRLRAEVAILRRLLILAVAAGRDGIGHAGAKDCKHCAALAECDAFLAAPIPVQRTAPAKEADK